MQNDLDKLYKLYYNQLVLNEMYRKEVVKMSFQKAINDANVKVSEVADYAGVPYFEFGKMIEGEIEMPEKVKNAVQFFLIKNYTKRIAQL